MSGGKMSTENEDSEAIEKEWMYVGFRFGVSSVAYPLEHARYLIQLGFEPIPPRQTYTLFGRPALGLPNVFEYLGYLRKHVGFLGLYRGIGSKFCATVTSNYVFDKVSQHITPFYAKNPSLANEERQETNKDKIIYFLLETAKDATAKCAAVICSQPFQVITIRTVAQFIGGEDKYRGLIPSLKQIYNEDGIGGFFSGLVPRLLGEIISLCLVGSLTFIISTYIVDDNEFSAYVKASMGFIASSVTYPFMLVSTVMAANNSGLAAGSPPNMPIYINWRDCWSHLKSQKQLKRGSSIIWRYYHGPYILEGGRPRAIQNLSFKAPTPSKLF